MQDVAIYGAGGLGCLVLDILEQAGHYRPVCFLDSDPAKHGSDVGGLPVIGGLAQIEELPQRGVAGIIVAIGDNLTRAAHAETLQAHGLELISAIHPLASISVSARLGQHLIIGPRVTICVNGHVGPHSVLSAGTIADHDHVIGVGVFLGPAVRLAGGVRIDDFARLDVGATVIPGRAVGCGAHVEAGAVVIRNVEPGTTVGGVPAVLTSRFVSGPATCAGA